MGASEILALIQIATQLAQVIDAEVQASDDAEVEAAWKSAKSMFNIGFNEDYTNVSK